MRYEFALGVQLVDDPVCVLLHASREDHDFEVLDHLPQELVAEGPNQEVGLAAVAVVHVVNQGFVQVEHERVLAIRREPTCGLWSLLRDARLSPIAVHWRQERRLDDGQLAELNLEG